MMKKKKTVFAVIISALVLMLSLSGCGGATGAYNKALNKYNTAGGITANGKIKITITKPGDDALEEAEEISRSVVTNITSALQINNGENMKASLLINTDVNPAEGNPVTAQMKAYYSDGQYYTAIGAEKKVFKMSREKALDQIGIYGLALGFADEDFEGIIMENEGENDIITFVISAKNSKKLMGLTNQLSRIIEGASIKYDHIQGKLVLGKKGIPVSQELTVVATLESGNEEYSVLEEIKTSFELFEDFAPVEFPGQGYTAVN